MKTGTNKKLRRRQQRRRFRQVGKAGGQAKAYSLTHMYAPGDLPRHAQIAVMEIEDPNTEACRIEDGTLSVEARLEQFRHKDGSFAKGAPGWTPPVRPRIAVIQSFKSDPVGHMWARKQIDQASFLAAREYQKLHIDARVGKVRSVDLGGSAVHCTNPSQYGITDVQRRAARILAKVDIEVFNRFGREALQIVRDVLCEGHTLDAAARQRIRAGTLPGERESRSWAWLFRKALNVVAIKLGYTNCA